MQKCCIINDCDCHLGLAVSWISSSAASSLPCCEEDQAAYGDNHLVRNGGLMPAAMCVNLEDAPPLAATFDGPEAGLTKLSPS